jgi:spermidine synthase
VLTRERSNGWDAFLVDGVVQSISPISALVDGGYWTVMLPFERPESALILGYGGGTLARLLRSKWGCTITGVDDDPEIVAAGRQHWGDVPATVVIGDACDYVKRCRERFDYVAIDLFRGQELEKRVLAKPFLRRVHNLLTPGGTVAVNLFRTHSSLALAEVFSVRLSLIVRGNLIVHAR